MNRAGLLIATAVAVLIGVPFAIYPQLDLLISAPFYNSQADLWVGFLAPVSWLREAARWLIVLIAIPAFIALGIKLVRPRRSLPIPGRAAVLMASALILGPGLLTNVALKDHWGRPRPIDVIEFRGQDRFVAWWDPRGECPKNCSFIAGEPSGAFWTFAVAAVAPPAWRALAYGAAVAFGAGVGLLRIMAGGHFFTDVLFAGVFNFFVVWLVHGVLYRWHRRWITDATVERLLVCAPAMLRRIRKVRSTWRASLLRSSGQVG
jgi:lipid A 4'-phosphatase